MILTGYFPKRVIASPGGPPSRASEICSVSNCVSTGPDGWIDRWLHNWLGWFNSVTDAWAVVPDSERATFRLFAYRLHEEFYRKGVRHPVVIPGDVSPEPLAPAFISIGFDSYSKTLEDVLGPECSPLSCNGLSTEYRVNRYCLFHSLDDAKEAALRFSIDEPEPGDYYVAEVLEWSKAAAEQ